MSSSAADWNQSELKRGAGSRSLSGFCSNQCATQRRNDRPSDGIYFDRIRPDSRIRKSPTEEESGYESFSPLVLPVGVLAEKLTGKHDPVGLKGRESW
jgi:hypothetical protein